MAKSLGTRGRSVGKTTTSKNKRSTKRINLKKRVAKAAKRTSKK